MALAARDTGQLNADKLCTKLPNVSQVAVQRSPDSVFGWNAQLNSSTAPQDKDKNKKVYKKSLNIKLSLKKVY